MRSVWFIWFVLFIWLVSFNQLNETDQTDRRFYSTGCYSTRMNVPIFT
jgi:hypothetical protein